SFNARKAIERFPLDPATNLAGALCALADGRSPCVVSRPEISKQFEKSALNLRRTCPRPAPDRVSDHPPLATFQSVAPSLLSPSFAERRRYPRRIPGIPARLVQSCISISWRVLPG